MQLLHGENVIGVLVGMSKTINGNYTNIKVCVCTGEYHDKFGTLQQNRVEIDVPSNREVEFQTFCDKNVGNTVQIPYRANVSSGVSKNNKPYAFLNRYVPKQAQPLVLAQAK